MIRALCLISLLIAAMPAEASRWGNSPDGIGLGPDGPVIFRECIRAAAEKHHVHPMVLLLLLDVERGKLGRVTQNTNGTVDIGPFQVNEIWLPQIARYWGVPEEEAFLELRDNFCGNAEAAGWILGQGLAENPEDFWGGVGRYHSATPQYQQAYLRKIAESARRMVQGAVNR